MSKFKLSSCRTMCVVATGVVFMGAVLALAQLGTSSTDAVSLAKSLKAGKVNLAAATTMAEAATRGVAVRAIAYPQEVGCFIEVHCMTDEKVMAMRVDCTTGKPGKPVEVKDLDSHVSAEAAAEAEAAGEAPSEAAVQAKLDEFTKAIKDGDLDRAEALLGELEGWKNLPETSKGKLDAARKSLETAKSAADAKSKLGLPK